MTNGIIIQRMDDRDTAVEVSGRVSRPKSRKLRIDSADSEMSVHVRAKYKCDPCLRFGAVVELSPELVDAITTVILSTECCLEGPITGACVIRSMEESWVVPSITIFMRTFYFKYDETFRLSE